ncbi:MAG: hypothetical protein WD200_02460 [Candidatus Andersenbacteria bacterium]
MEEQAPQKSSGYGKRPMWQWLLIYLVAGAIVYGLIYYFVIAKEGGYGTGESVNPTDQDIEQGLY